MRQRHALYLSVAMAEQLNSIAETRRLSKSEVLERALQAYLAAETDGGPAHLLALRQERNEQALGRLEGDVAIATELATFVRFFMTITPPLPKSETEAARAPGQLRFRQVIAGMARRLNSDDHLIARVLSELEQTSTEPATSGWAESQMGRDDCGEPGSPSARWPSLSHPTGWE